MTPAPLLADLTAKARATAHARSSSCPCGAATLADRPDGIVVRHADTVAKAHPPESDPTELTSRTRSPPATPRSSCHPSPRHRPTCTADS